MRVGYLSQEPQLDESREPSLENVMDGLGEVGRELRQRFDEISARFADVSDDDEMNTLLAEQGDLQEKIDSHDACY